MSRRPIEEKQRRRASKVFRRKLPAYFEIRQWLIDHDHAATKREANVLLLAGKVKSGSHVVGRQSRPTLQADGKTIKEEAQVVPYVRSSLRDNLLVAQ